MYVIRSTTFETIYHSGRLYSEMHFQISTIFFMVPDYISTIFSIVLNIVRYESGLNINSFTAPSDVTQYLILRFQIPVFHNF